MGIQEVEEQEYRIVRVFRQELQGTIDVPRRVLGPLHELEVLEALLEPESIREVDAVDHRAGNET